MNKLPRNVKGKQLIAILERLGFKIVGKRGSHVRLKHPNGKWTQVAVHPKPIPQGTLRTILRQTDITMKDLEKCFDTKYFNHFSEVTAGLLAVNQLFPE